MRMSPMKMALPVVALLAMFSAADGRRNPVSSDTAAIPCRLMEVHTDATLGVTMAIFHQWDSQDRDALAGFLRAHDDGAVEFLTADGVHHPARLFRLGSCFGRGALFFRSTEARLSPKGEIRLGR